MRSACCPGRACDRAHEGVRRIARLMLPGIFGSSVAQVSLLLDTLIASFLMTGSITWLYYADRLVEFPLGVFSHRARDRDPAGPRVAPCAKSRREKFTATLDWALRLTLTVVVPAAVGLLVLAGPLIATIFGYGAFTHATCACARYALMAYSLGLHRLQDGQGAGARLLRAPGHEDAGARSACIALAVNMVFNVAIVRAVRFLNGFPVPHVLLALSTGLSALVNATLLYRGLRRAGHLPAVRGLEAPAAADRPSQASPWRLSCGGFPATALAGPNGTRRAGPLWLGDLGRGRRRSSISACWRSAGARPRDLKHL